MSFLADSRMIEVGIGKGDVERIVVGCRRHADGAIGDVSEGSARPASADATQLDV